MGDVTSIPTISQPPPVHVPGAASVHDMVCAELGARSRHANLLPSAQDPAAGRRARQLIRLLRERRAIGLRTYSTVLQVENGRDPCADGLEELADAVVYFFQAKARGVPGAAGVFEAVLTIAMHAADRWYWPASVGHPGQPEHGLLFRHYLDAVADYREHHPEQRDGQAHFNVLSVWDITIAREIEAEGRQVNPFYNDDVLPAFLTFVARRMGEEQAAAA